jgi:hypothetical protein
MLLIKRLGTCVVLFLALFMVAYVGSMGVGGGIAGARDANNRQAQGSSGFQEGFNSGRQVGAAFAKDYGVSILLCSLAGSGLASLIISFSGILPWCREDPKVPGMA